MARKVSPQGSPTAGGMKLLYIAQPGPQEELMTSAAEEVLYGGAAGGGKSYGLRMFLVNYCLQYPGARVVLFRRTFRELEDTHISLLQQELPSFVATYSVGKHEFIFTNGSVLMLRFCEHEEDVYSYDCVGIDTPILTDDLRWVPAGELKVGDGILGFDEEQQGPRQKRKLQRAIVTRQNLVAAPTHRIHLADGTTIDAVPNHKWLVCVNKSLVWRSTGDLYAIQESKNRRFSHRLTLRRALPTTKPETTYDAGFLSAAFDGEGCLSKDTKHAGLKLNFVQKKNPMLNRVRSLLSSYKIGEYARGNVQALVSSITTQTFELLMRLRPPRLMKKFSTLTNTLTIPRVGDIEITRIDPLVPRMIAELSSSSKTYIADGFLAHNTFEADAMAFDELTAFSEFQYVYLLTRCRSTKAWWPGRRIRSATNPGNVGHVWVKRRFIDFASPYVVKKGLHEEGGMTREFIPARVSDNPALMRRDPDYIKLLRALPDELYRAKALGDWSVFSGQFFGKWREGIHVVKPFAIPHDWQRYICTDWGIAVPHATYWAARPPGTSTLYIYREQYGANVPTAEQARQARMATTAAAEKIEFVVTDPAMWAKGKDAEGREMLSVADYWKQEFYGICDVLRGNNERLQGASLFREKLDWQGVETDNELRVIQQPQLYFMKSCVNAIRTIPALIHSSINAEDVDTNSEDHAYDSVRYLLRALFAAMPLPKQRRYVLDSRGNVIVVAT